MAFILSETVFVYQFTNLINGMMYIGVTNNLRRRYAEHTHVRNKRRLGRAIRKYGLENFSFEVLSSGTRLESLEREKELVASHPKSMLYNISAGGILSHSDIAKYKAWWALSTPSIETRRKMSLNSARKGKPSTFKNRKHTVASILKMKKALKGRPANNYGVPKTESAKIKMSVNRLIKLAERQTSFNHSETTKEKISSALRQNYIEKNGHAPVRKQPSVGVSDSTRLLQSKAKIGKNRPISDKIKISNATKGDKNPAAIHSPDQVMRIFNSVGTYREIAEQFETKIHIVSQIKTGLTWSHLTGKYHPRIMKRISERLNNGE